MGPGPPLALGDIVRSPEDPPCPSSPFQCHGVGRWETPSAGLGAGAEGARDGRSRPAVTAGDLVLSEGN